MGKQTKIPTKLYRSKSDKHPCNHKCPVEQLKSKSSEQCVRQKTSHECDYCNGLFPIESEEDNPTTPERVSLIIILIIIISYLLSDVYYDMPYTLRIMVASNSYN